MRVSLCNEDGVYEAASSLAARWRVSRVPRDELQSLVISVLWHTEGKGDEDLHVHHFHRITEPQLRRLDTSVDQSIECVLPATPLSYHGLLIRLTWCVRLRLYLTGGREIVTEQPFYLVASKRHAPYAASTHWVDGESKDEVHGEVGSPLLARSRQQLSAHGSASQ